LSLPSAPPPTVTLAGLPGQLALPFAVPGPGPAPGTATGWAAPGETAALAQGPQATRNLLVLEGTGSGLLNLLAHSAVSDLADGGGPVSVTTVAFAEEGISALTQVPFQCVVVDLGAPSAPDFLDQVTQKAELHGIPILAHARQGLAGTAGGRINLAALRQALGTLELLPSLDQVRERITSALTAAPPALTAAAPAVADPAAVAPAPAASVTAQDRKPTAGTRHPALRGRKALVVDDDPRNVFAIASTLRLSGMNVTEAASGQAGISALLDEPDIDVILMDIMMPGMDGYATMSLIRQMPDFARLPIIAVTARAMVGDRDKSIDAGASDYVTKPVDPEDLLSRIEHWLSPATP
jgi:CheY-like chemotaxis protein